MNTPIRSGWQQSDSEHDHNESCIADIGLTEAEIDGLNWAPRGGFQQMPYSGKGFECYGPRYKCYGRPEVIETLLQVCAEWAEKFPNGPRIGIGNISLSGGGPMPPHSSHQRGLDVDLAPVASTADEIPLKWWEPKYSRQRTQLLVDLIRNNFNIGVKTILFNDPDITGVVSWPGHDNHLHVSFLPSGVGSVDFSSDRNGYLRLVVPPMKGARVRKLQEDLVQIGFDLAVDSIFGENTEEAVRNFQSDRELDVDGIVGPITEAKLAQVIRETASRGIRSSSLSLQVLIDQNKSIPFDNINSSLLVDDEGLCREIQVILKSLNLLTVIDGLYGPKTREALRLFKASRQLGGGDVLGSITAKALLEARPGTGILSNWQGGDKKAAIQAIIQEAYRLRITNKSQIAYILATVQHETNDSFQPVKEGYYLGEPKAENYRQTLRYYPYYGRGYVQLTWRDNYQEYSDLLELDLVNNPDLVMRPDISVFILIDGMKRGVFTGVSLDDYISVQQVDFFNARRIVNGLDQAQLIASYAQKWEVNLA
ncbi:penicillin-insensitive murein endopeptidase [Dapis sp. BLCC M229]|uniref:penicillin-insensitive murein endopeptidase n=1 Tax=Dapis sp. BLCC M229 TaxID=3400188 RepID=UPI003CEFA32B